MKATENRFYRTKQSSDELSDQLRRGEQAEKAVQAMLELERSLRIHIARQQQVIDWVDGWVSNPVGAYSVSALAGLFAMTRDKINSLKPVARERSAT